MNELDAILSLNAIQGLGNKRIRNIIDYYGSAKDVLFLSKTELESHGVIPSGIIENIIHFPKDIFLKNEYNLITKHGIKVFVLGEEGYPYLLSQIPDAPVVLYTKGSLGLTDDCVCLGVVGSRNASVYGVNIAQKISSELAGKGVIVVSGLARGIDTAAHKGALKVMGRTVGVLGSGLANVYPKENMPLFEQIAEEGLVISEYSMMMPPLAYNFPRRNRIISGLSCGVIVVEAAQKSGALITADFALEQGREVYAVPGPIDRLSSCGVNHLIQQGAKLITSAEDIFDDLRISFERSFDGESADKRLDKFEVSEEELELYQYIERNPVHFDVLASKMNGKIALTHKLLLQLEIKHAILQLPGKNFKRLN